LNLCYEKRNGESENPCVHKNIEAIDRWPRDDGTRQMHLILNPGTNNSRTAVKIALDKSEKSRNGVNLERINPIHS
jgi:hypothetical protein